MTSGLVSELLTNLGIVRSHSRPRISNDNPFSEAQFKTLKYLHDFPKSFASLTDAREFLEGFFNELQSHSSSLWNWLAYAGVGAFWHGECHRRGPSDHVDCCIPCESRTVLESPGATEDPEGHLHQRTCA